MNPHAKRYNFVTICKWDYDLDNDTIKWLIGHPKDSRVMETTYSHLSDKDFADNAEGAFGLKQEENRSTLTPQQCTCGATIEANARACSNCGIIFTPDALTAQSVAGGHENESSKQTDSEDPDTQGKLDMLDDLLEDPDVKAALLEKLNE